MEVVIIVSQKLSKCITKVILNVSQKGFGFIFRSAERTFAIAECTFATAERTFATAERRNRIAEYKTEACLY